MSRTVTASAVAVGAFLCVGELVTGAQTGPARKPDIAQTKEDHEPGETTYFGGILCKDVESGGTGCRQAIEAELVKRKPEGPVPRTAWDGKPDFNGVYSSQVAIVPSTVTLESLLRPDMRSARDKLDRENSPPKHCAPNSPAFGSMTPPHPVQLIHAPGVLVMIDEQFNTYRIIPTDGRPHDPARVPSLQGDSVGRWEGDTLVVDVTNFNGQPWLTDSPLPVPTSTALHIVERWTRPDAHTFEYEAVIEDPKMLTGPWTASKLRRGRLRFDLIHESFCVEDSANTPALESHGDLEEKGLLRK